MFHQNSSIAQSVSLAQIPHSLTFTFIFGFFKTLLKIRATFSLVPKLSMPQFFLWSLLQPLIAWQFLSVSLCFFPSIWSVFEKYFYCFFSSIVSSLPALGLSFYWHHTFEKLQYWSLVLLPALWLVFLIAKPSGEKLQYWFLISSFSSLPSGCCRPAEDTSASTPLSKSMFQHIYLHTP